MVPRMSILDDRNVKVVAKSMQGIIYRRNKNRKVATVPLSDL